MSYATLSDLKTFVGIPTGDTQDDVALQLALDSSTNQIDGWCGQSFGITTQTRTYMAPYRLDPLELDAPLASTSGLSVTADTNGDGTFDQTWTLNTDFRLEPTNAAYKTPPAPWTRITPLGTLWWPILPYPPYRRPSVQVTGSFGWPGSVPQAVKLANLIQASRLFKRKDAPFGVAGSVEFGSEMRLLNELDRDAQNLLAPYRRKWWVA